MRVVQTPPEFTQSLHRHDGARLIVFLSGAYVERSFSERAAFEAGDFVVRPRWYAHDGASSIGAAYTHLSVTERALKLFFGEHGWRAWRGRVALDSIRDLQGDPIGGDTVLASAPVRPLDQHAGDLHAIARALDSECEAPLEQLAEANGLTPWTLSRRFARAFGMAPRAFRLQARVQRAMRLLAETDTPVAVVAAQASFSDQSHLTHALKRAVGLAPSAVRRQLALA